MSNDIVQKPDTAAADTRAAETPAVSPAVDIWETEAGIELAADLPGVSRESLNLGIDGDTLTIEGTVALQESAGMQAIHADVRSPTFRRSFTLSRELDASRITANLRHGTLRLTIPRQEAAKPRRIEVSTSA